MEKQELKCFVIMPFISELHYFYLYIKEYLKNNYSIECKRADERILTIPFHMIKYLSLILIIHM